MNPAIVAAVENLLALVKAEGGTAPAPDKPAPGPIPEGHTYLPKTGNLLPNPEAGHASISGYGLDVTMDMGWTAVPFNWRQANEALALAVSSGMPASVNTDKSLWPEALDRYFNRSAYGISTKPQPENIKLAASYPSAGALIAATAGYLYAVTLDGAEVHGGFGPPDKFYTQANGSVSTSKPSAPGLPPVGSE